jgi:hypothetical protein
MPEKEPAFRETCQCTYKPEKGKMLFHILAHKKDSTC